MMRIDLLTLGLVLVGLHLQAQPPAPLVPDPPITCDSCADWNGPRAPFRLYGNTYFVGTAGLSAVLLTSPEGHVLIDGALPQSAAQIDANIRALGFETRDIRVIVNSHAHYDHAGGIAALQRASGATVAATAASARALEAGEPMADDPQHGFGREGNAFAPVPQVKVIRDGEVLRVGDIAITAHAKPGHTPGGTTWSWRSCEGAACLDLVYADSLTAVSAPGYRFSDTGQGDALRASIARVAALPCDIVVAAHPSFTDLDGKLARTVASPTNPFVDKDGCRAYAATAAKRLTERLASERTR